MNTRDMLHKAMELLEMCYEVYPSDPDAEHGRCVACNKPTWKHADDCQYVALEKAYRATAQKK